MTLDALLATNIFSRTPGGVQREYVPFNEALTAQAFADAINSGKMSVEDAWTHFWSYEEDAALFGTEGRNYIPAWSGIIYTLFEDLSVNHAGELLHIMTIANFQIGEHGLPRQSPSCRRYNPFFDNLYFALCLALTRPGLTDTLMNMMPEDSPDEDHSDKEYSRSEFWFPWDPDWNHMLSRTMLQSLQARRRELIPESAARTALEVSLDRCGYIPDKVVRIPPHVHIEHTTERVETRRLHESIKPRGYTHPVKKVVIPDDT